MPRSPLEPLEDASRERLAAVRCVLTDIDDTLTDDGLLSAQAYTALERLSRSGLAVLPVTGRPAGWCDLIARLWPVAGVIGENGALAFRYDHPARRMRRLYAKSEAEFARDRSKLDAVSKAILAAVPGSAIASDQAYRLADLAIDYREDVAPLPPDAVAEIVRHFEAAGATAKVSSIHVNGWYGSYDKLSMATRVLDEFFGISLAASAESVLYAGDSPNDEPFFAALPLTVGVANVRDFASAMRALPSYVTLGRGGQGFTELADALLAARGLGP